MQTQTPLTDALFTDLLDPRITLLDVCRKHSLPVTEALAVIETPIFQQAAAALIRAEQLRSTALAPDRRERALATLERIIEQTPSTPTHTECIRRAANTLLRAAKDAAPPDLGAAASQPPDRAQPDADDVGGAEFHSANRAQPDAPDLGAEGFQPSDRAQPDADDVGAPEPHSATTPVPCSSSSKSTLLQPPIARASPNGGAEFHSAS